MDTPTVPTPATGEAASPGFDVRYYVDLLWRGRALIAAAAVAGLALGLVVAFLQVPEYRAAAMVQIDPPTPTFMNVSDAAAMSGSYWQNADFYNTQFKVLRSRALAEQVVERLKLKDSAFKDAPDAASAFIAHVGVEPVPDSRLVMIQVTHRDPKEAALWANTLANVYIDHTLASRIEASRRAYDWLQERLSETQASMHKAREKLATNYGGEDSFVPEGMVAAVSTSVGKLAEDYIEAQSRRIALEAALKQAASMRGRRQGLENLPQVAEDKMAGELTTQIGALELDLARLKERFREAHPDLQKVQEQIAELQRVRARRAEEVVEGVRVEHAQLLKRESELRAAIEAQKQQAAAQSRRATEMETLKKEAQSANSLYDALLQKLSETDLAATVRSSQVQLVDQASPPRSPVRPDKKRMAGSALAIGLALGIALVLGKDYLDNTLKSPEDVERYLRVNLLAAVPRYDESSVHLVTEAYQNLRTALLFARKDPGGQVVLVTGTAPQEGKTTTLINLAKLLASAGEKTVMVDCDLRRAQLHQRMGLSRQPGFTDYFVKHDDLDGLIQATRVPNLFALTAGPLPPNPPAILTRREIPVLLDALRKHFEWVIIDSPPLASVTDALLLARQADMAVFVIQHNKVDKKIVKRAIAALQRATPSLLGAVFNAVDLKAKSYYYYYYHQETDTPGAAKPRRPVAVAKR
ncbi:MAG TPA: polysaccharide biosynthesis tyrosine autokinase [Vicinamibacteria bacterium]|nr:polysaccharide biosynthesis tyrosine autokinase [Vicinamibacteria bacterium]